MNTTHVAVDLAKSVFQIAISHTPGRVHTQRRLSRASFLRFFAAHDPVHVWMEACGSSHHWGRQLQAMGHNVSLLPPADVSRYRDGSKTDRADTKAILEAARNRALDPVPVKSEEQQAITALHRLRSGYLATRTARINAVRGHLREFGVSIPLGARHVVPQARAALEQDLVPDFLLHALLETLEEIEALQDKAESIRKTLTRLAEHMPAAAHLMTIPGIGVLTATALLAFVGDPYRFRSGRRFAAYLGLTPREHSSGPFRRLGRITNTTTANRSDRRGAEPITCLALHGPPNRLAPRARLSIVAGAPSAHFKGRRYDCSRPPRRRVALALRRTSPDTLVRLSAERFLYQTR